MSLENGNTINNNSFITIDTILNNNGTDYYYDDRCKESDRYDFSREDNDITNETSDNNRPTVIYRFKFTEQFMEELYKFSKIHQYDDRKDFKEAWL